MDHGTQVDVAAGAGPGAGRRVLLVMPPHIANAAQPHLGLGLLATRLRAAGFAPLVVDYAYRPRLPKIEFFLGRFDPAIVGISLFSQHLTKTKRFIHRIREVCPETPIVLGGPHVTISGDEDLAELRACGATVTVQGEAEDEIVEVVETTLAGRAPANVSCAPADLDRYTWPDFRLVVDGRDLVTYPQQLSRGCPYRCIFCNVKRIAGRKFRVRDVDDAIAEIADAQTRYPRLQFVKVTDDAPNTIPERIERYLAGYLERRLAPRLEIMQLRADNLTPGMARMLRQAGAPYVVVGVESGEPSVFARVNKGETLDDIRRACRTVKQAELPLVMCFVLGLPGATAEKDGASIEFAREMGPAHCYWNVAQPMPGTDMFDFFSREGRILSRNVAEESSLGGDCHADTPDYPAGERLRTQIVAQASTNELSIYWPYFLFRGARLGSLPSVCKAMALHRPEIPAGIERRW